MYMYDVSDFSCNLALSVVSSFVWLDSSRCVSLFSQVSSSIISQGRWIFTQAVTRY